MTRIGILGGGQLGRMLALSGYPLGLTFRFFDPSPDAPVCHLAELAIGAYGDTEALDRFADGLDLVTYEFENVPATAAQHLSRSLPVYPPVKALDVAQDRLREKQFFNAIGIGTPRYRAVDTWDELHDAVNEIGLPAVLKTRREGYDGKGQEMLRAGEDLEPAWQRLGGRPLILEAFVPFDLEVAVIAARNRHGETASWPPVRIVQRQGMLHRAFVPADGIGSDLEQRAVDGVSRALRELEYVGVLAVEFFVVGGEVLGNEMAPRVHNSGHWTIEGAVTSQFENHLRAILGWPLGTTGALGAVALLNLIGQTPHPADVLLVTDAHLHLYGKAQRSGRKLGHITVRATDQETLAARVAELDRLIDG